MWGNHDLQATSVYYSLGFIPVHPDFFLRVDCDIPFTSNSKLLGNLLAAAAAKSLQLCPTLCDPIDGSPPGSPVPGILQARTLEQVAISFSNA